MNLLNNKTLPLLFVAISSITLSACSTQASKRQSLATGTEAKACTRGSLRRGDCKLPGLPTADTVVTEDKNDLWYHVTSGYQLTQHAAHPKAKKYFEYFRDRPTYLSTIAERSSPYLYYIVEAIRKRNMPMEFALLPAIESSYDPFAYSHGRAAGLWQFVPITATHMGLPRTWWYDARRDVVASTEAALDYLLELHQRFDGDWLLAMAAYNSGATTVLRAMAKNERAGRPTDYWSLDLPRETEAYIPKLIGLSQLIKRAKYEGIDLEPMPNTAAFAVVDTGGQIDLAQAAELAGVSIEQLYRLNPGFNRWATDPNGPHHLAIPLDKHQQFTERLSQIPPEKRLNWSRYRVVSGDSLIKIARRFNTDVATIKAANQLNNSMIRAGQVLMLPSASMAAAHYSLSADQRLASAQKRGESDDRVAHQHTVEQGDSLWTISRRYGVSVNDLARWNNMVPKDPLRAGKKLVVWKPAGQQVAVRSAASRSIIRWIGYTVRPGDSLARIADKFSLSVNDILEWNEISKGKYLMPGQVLNLYVDVTQVSGR
ncbi:LysM peptidoglycan-binding domain-containing protein [Litorivivens sp.]|uniref:lytic transglycosylase n=1 Tax=Litorivivens sp. TaxID=2020868 RepID=UPI003562CC5C